MEDLRWRHKCRSERFCLTNRADHIASFLGRSCVKYYVLPDWLHPLHRLSVRWTALATSKLTRVTRQAAAWHSTNREIQVGCKRREDLFGVGGVAKLSLLLGGRESLNVVDGQTKHSYRDWLEKNRVQTPHSLKQILKF